MDGQDIELIKLVQKNQHFVIPPYQRSYQWIDKNWQTLIQDIMNVTTRPDTDPSHWMGIFLMSAGKPIPGSLDQQHIVVDGQQRLVTLRIWLAALEHAAKDNGKPLDEFDCAEITVQDSDMPCYKAALGNQWRDSTWREYLSQGPLGAYAYFRWILWLGEHALLSEEPIKFPPSRKTAKPFESFETEWKRYCEKKEILQSTPADLRTLRDATLKRLKIYALSHQPQIDEPHAEIFDTLNGDRTPLEPLDHVRNSLFTRITEERIAQDTYKKIWAPLEKRIRDCHTRRIKSETLFLYDFLISQGQNKIQGSINSRRGAAHFAQMTGKLKDDTLVDFLKDYVAPSMACWPAIIGRGTNFETGGRSIILESETHNLLQSIRELSEGPAVPAIMFYMVNFVRGVIPKQEDLRRYLHLIESYIVRWILGGRPLSPLRSRFIQILRDIDGKIDITVLKNVLSSDCIKDQSIKKLSINDPYFEKVWSVKVGAILRGIERSKSGAGSNWFQLGKKEGQYTIEHIYPQSSTKWEPDLLRWKQSKDEMNGLLHTLGNLTVVTFEHNRIVGNSAFKEKQKYPTKQGQAAPMKLNESWLTARRWTAKEIKDRTEELISSALEYWNIDRA
jgi:hypothetical protein